MKIKMRQVSSKLAVWFSKGPSLGFLKLPPWFSTDWSIYQRATALLSSSKMAPLDHVGRLSLLPPLLLQQIQKWFSLLCFIFNTWFYSKLIAQTDITHCSPSSPFHWLSFLSYRSPNGSSAHASSADLSLNTELHCSIVLPCTMLQAIYAWLFICFFFSSGIQVIANPYKAFTSET